MKAISAVHALRQLTSCDAVPPLIRSVVECEHSDVQPTSSSRQPTIAVPAQRENRQILQPPAWVDQAGIVNFPSIFISMKTVVLKSNNKRTAMASANITCALAFNLALCYHMLSSSRSAKMHAYRINSIQLYKVSHDLRLKISRMRPPGQTAKLTMLDLSILNNAGLLLMRAGENDRARRCFEQLSLGLHRFDSRKVDSAGFVRNLSILLPESILSPAA